MQTLLASNFWLVIFCLKFLLEISGWKFFTSYFFALNFLLEIFDLKFFVLIFLLDIFTSNFVLDLKLPY